MAAPRTYSPCGPEVLTTPRLRLRPWTVADAPRVAELAAPFEVVEFTAGLPYPFTADHARDYVTGAGERWARGEAAQWAIESSERDRTAEHPVVGAISARLDGELNSVDMGYWLGLEAWGRGLATEAARAVVTWAFEVWGANRVQAHHVSSNPPSGRVLQKIGMRREGLLRQGYRRWGRYEDVVLYAVLRDEWDGTGAAPDASV